MVVLLFLIAVAWAQEEESDLEITVEAERIERAKQRLIGDLAELGYKNVKDKGDHVILRHDRTWKGQILLYDDGWVQMKRQPLRFEPPWKKTALGWSACVVVPWMCVRTGGVLVNKRKFMSQKVRTLNAVDGDVDYLASRVADHYVYGVVNDLPARMEALWFAGVPLEQDGVVLHTYGLRRLALLAYWESRTDTEWGDAVRLAVEAFMRAEVQTGDHPFIDSEINALNERHRVQRVLDLERPWEDVIRDWDAGELERSIQEEATVR